MRPVLPLCLDWPSVIGRFIMNFGVLELTLMNFLKRHLRQKEVREMLDETFHKKVVRLCEFVDKKPEMVARKAQWSHLIDQLKIVRDLRNHLAHSTLINTLAVDGATITQRLSLTKDASVGRSDAVEITFEELISQNQVLADAVSELIELDGTYSAPETV